MSEELNANRSSGIPWWPTVICTSLAGGMGWGIRGQYGHETGAMIAGVLVCLVIVLTLCRNTNALTAARAVALGTIAMGFGGTETYGQTIGLTQNPEMIGNWSAFAWGMLGLAIKGSVWIGFCGLFLGMGLGGKRYRAHEMLAVMLGALLAYKVGVMLLNSPYDLASRQLPRIYFSATWELYPNQADPKPRYEAWGGIWFAMLFVMAYAGMLKKDGLAWRLGLWGLLGGALGFPLGQCVQAYHAWNAESFTEGVWKILNWWNCMETTFGLTMGAILGLGAWLHRARIRPAEYERESYMEWPIEWALLFIHCSLVVFADVVIPFKSIEAFYDLGLIMGVIPIVAVAGGRWWPYLTVFPVTLLPIAGKTVYGLAHDEQVISMPLGLAIYVVIPIAAAHILMFYFLFLSRERQTSVRFASSALLFCAWVYFLLNYAIFRFPWPWETWTARTPNAIVFAICLVALTALAIAARGEQSKPSNVSNSTG
ncbi:MAG: hypothetical protein K1Y02_20860 [Candidatus Hydrogenedentes bacterium]|nr:hypothetical protein [Candidatus Hydrogenedentota bacterium]